MQLDRMASRGRVVAFCSTLLFATVSSRAATRDEPSVLGSARVLSADPNAPAFALMWRGTLRGTMSSRLPMAGNVDEGGPHLALLPLVELHNDPGNREPLPNDDWRGRLSLEAGYTFTPRETGIGWASLTFAVQHESDHRSARVGTGPGFLELNDVALRGALAVPLGRAVLISSLELALLAGSCTIFSTPCRDLRGGTTIASTAEATLTTREIGPWAPFVSAAAMSIVPSGAVALERRVVVHAGIGSRTQHRGLWQAGFVLFVGNDVGVTRDQKLEQLGAFIRWSP